MSSNKLLFGMALMFSLAIASNISLSDSNISNKSGELYILTNDSCIIINSIILNITNLSICANAPTEYINNTITQNITQPLNINVSLPWGNSTINPTANFSVYCQAAPVINIDLNGGQSYTNGSINFHCNQSNYTTNYTNYVYVKKNISRNMTEDETYFDADTNITLYCPAKEDICKRNIMATVLINQSYHDELCNITVNGQAKMGVDKTMAYGEIYQRDDWGIKFTAPAACAVQQACQSCVIGQTVILDSTTPVFENSTASLRVECRQTNTLQSAISSSSIENCTTTIVTIPNTNFTYCNNNVLTVLSQDERAMGVAGIESAINRIASTATNEGKQCRIDNVKCNADLTSCNSDKKTNTDLFTSITDVGIVLIAGLCVIFGIVLYLKKKTKGE